MRCRKCGGTRRWRDVESHDHVGCWTCWRCTPPPPNRRLDLVVIRAGSPFALFAHYAGRWSEADLVAEVQANAAPIAMGAMALPCFCQRCRGL